jgi:hypothetical protein
MNAGRCTSSVAVGLAAFICGSALGAQALPVSHSAAAPVRIALLGFAFYGKHANSIEPGDSAMGDSATAAVRRNFVLRPEITLADSAAVAAAESSPAATDTSDGHPCNTIIACGRVVGRAVGARYAVMGTISKTSNLIWVFSGQLVDVTAHDLVLDDEYELKGDSRDMVAQGSRVFAGRVAKKLGVPPATGTTH